MKTTCWFRTSGTVFTLFALCLAGLGSYGAVTAEPAKATFASMQQSAVIKLTNNGAPLPAKDIRGWQFIASGHDYKHMIIAEKMDGALKITPSPTMEVGSYDLNIDTAGGGVTVQVFAPLSDVPDIVEKLASISGESERKIKEKLGMVAAFSSEETQIELSSVYYEGQTLELTIPTPSGHMCSWFINGELVAEGQDQSTLSYTFKEPGPYVINYIESLSNKGEVKSATRAIARTRVVPVPAIPTEVAVNTEMTFEPPLGYKSYVWRMDGREMSRQASLKHAFKEPGVYAVECLASAPNSGPVQGFLRIRYTTTVKPL